MFCASKHWRPLLAAGIKADVLGRVLINALIATPHFTESQLQSEPQSVWPRSARGFTRVYRERNLTSFETHRVLEDVAVHYFRDLNSRSSCSFRRISSVHPVQPESLADWEMPAARPAGSEAGREHDRPFKSEQEPVDKL
jgi:hypothetical protein